MFRRGGSTNRNPDSGIVSGFKRGGTIPKRGLVDSPGGYSGEEYAELVQKYMQAPVEEEGMTTSDWLRIAASGANIMVAPSTGRSDVWGALQAAGPSLGELGTGLADSRDARRASYLTRKNANYRQIINEGDIIDELKSKNFKIIDIDALSINKKVDVFS